MEKPSKWYSRKYMGWIGFVLFVTGICAAIVFFPTIPILSLLLFALIGGLGVFISYKRKMIDTLEIGTRWVILIGFWIASWGYGFYAAVILPIRVPMLVGTFFFDFWMTVMPVVGLVTLPVAWFVRWKRRHTLKSFILTYLIYLLIIVPFPYALLQDYNVRADTSVAEVISMKVVRREIINFEGDMEIEVETLDGNLRIEFYNPTESFYNEHNIGSLVEVIMRRGALGYPWVEGYK